jgi:hypothetical protein
MSVIDINKVDGMGKSKEGNELLFLISDHLDWGKEYEHLKILQDKINAYIEFIEGKQFLSTYPDDSFESYVIEIHFKYDITENCFKFLDIVANQVEKINIKIRAELA